MKISFDVGGVITKYPEVFVPIIKALQKADDIEVYILTDMDREASKDILNIVNLDIPDENLLNGDWDTHGESCKKVIIEKESIDLHIDDLPSYCQNSAISLMVWPNNDIPYNTLGEYE